MSKLLCAAGAILALLIVLPDRAGAALALYVTETSPDDQVTRYDEDGVLIDVFAPGFTFNTPYNVTSRGNRIYVAHPGTQAIEIFSPDGTHLDTYGGSLVSPSGMAFDASGTLFVAEFQFGGQELERFDSTGNPLGPIGGANLISPWGVVLDGDGNLLVVDDNNGHIERFDTAGNWLGTWADGGDGLRGIVLDPAGNAYVTGFFTGSVFKFSPAGVPLGVFASGFAGPWGITIDGDGNLYVAEYSASRVSKVDPLGNRTTFVTGVGFPVGLAWAPAPEPGALLMVAAALAGLALRRR